MATPSPLRTNLPRPGDSDSPQMSSSSSSANPSPFTHIAHAAFPAPPSAGGHSSSAVPNLTDRRPLRSGNESDGNKAENKGHLPARNAPAGITGQPTTSSPESFESPLHSLPDSRSTKRIIPRTSSIDSAISSLSSSQSQKSFDASALTAADIENLIAAAGSAEAVIVHLLKEKHHAASQNSQLWRLVEKQRKLILGLNKDLERALKEKEKHKRKAEDLQISVPPLPRADSQTIQPAAGERNDLSGHGTSEQSQANNLLTENAETRALGAKLENPSSSNATRPTQSDHSEGLTRELDSQGASNLPATRRLSMSTPGSDESPISDHKGGAPHPNRKPPPAPLNLRQMERSTAEQAERSDSESEYEDMLLADDFSAERGRKKTRGDDDREREAALERDEKAGGVFEKKGNNTPSDGNTHNISVAGRLPPGLRQMTAQFPPGTQRRDPATSALSSEMTRSASDEGQPVASAPKSPGLPLSPRPEDRPFGSALPRMPREVPAPLSIPKGNSNISGLALSPRAVKGQIPSNSASVMGANDGLYTPISNRGRPLTGSSGPSHTATRGIYRGFMSKDYPNFLLPPNALPLIQVKVSSSRLRPSRNSYTAARPFDEEPVFTLSVFSRSKSSELWRVEKVIAALPDLDQQIKQLCSFEGKLPDRSMFIGHSPAKVDARRAALNSYFDALLDTPMDENAAAVVCQFLSSEVIEPRDDETSLLGNGTHEKRDKVRGSDGKPGKEGYLTKRGKNFGGWKARYFVLHGPELKYFETPTGPHMGTIKLQHAQIGRQSEKMNSQGQSPSRADDDTENQYRHAFLILEPKKKDSSALVRHVLCAESDEERDAWVEALLEYVESHSENEGSYNAAKGHSQTQERQPTNTTQKPRLFAGANKKNGRAADNVDSDAPDTVQGFSFDDAVAAEPPVLGPTYESARPSQLPPGVLDSAKGNRTSSPTLEQLGSPHPIISGPTNGAVIQNAGAWGNKAAATSTKEKKRSIWGFRTRSSAELASQVQANSDGPTAQGTLTDRKDVRPVFGMPLSEAAQVCAPQGVDVDLPAVVYRCIEFLEAKDAASEEGIFRLSGSNVVVKALKERFNTEGDVDLLAGDQNYDVHAVASLFKQYLRELPTTVLTRELHLDFLRVLGMHAAQPVQWKCFANARSRT